jgi:hypothetical protein
VPIVSLAIMNHFSLIPVAYAALGSANPCTSLGQFSALCSLTNLSFGFVVSTAIEIILIITVILAVFYFIFGGIKWILSRGDKEKVEDARNHIVASIVGLILAFLAFFIISLVISFFFPGKKLQDLTLPTLGPDTNPPTVAISSPTVDANVSGTVIIQTDATDDRQVAKVEFYVDNTLKDTVTKEPYKYSWNTTIYKHNSVHILLAKAYDDSDNVGTSDPTRVVVLDITKPTVKITNPINGGKMPSNSNFTISAFASDVSSVIQVEFRVNGTLKCTSYKIPYVCSWKIPAIKGVIYRIEASALDTAGNIGTQSISVTSI